MLRITHERDAMLITEDKDFGELVFRLRAVHAGVALVRMPGTPAAGRDHFPCDTDPRK
ncbi:MAG: DUF5615 family PIN-like protein [Flavobacteriales bacterium]|nr:DUF5615 family PIN-like protein [Flavobacteriales bacterium]